MTPRRAVRYLAGYLRYHAQMIRMSPPRLLGVALGALGIATAITELVAQVGVLAGTLICLAVLALYLFLIVRYPGRAAERAFPDDLRYSVVVPPTPGQTARIAEACIWFGDSAIDPIDGAQAIEADEYSTVALRDYKGREVGFADYYAFRRRDAQDYIDGRIPKRDFFADYYLPHPRARSAGAIYVSTVFRYEHISDRSAFGAKEAALLVWCLIRLIEEVQAEPEDGWLIFASGGSQAGERLIRHFGLEESGRRDPDGNRIFSKDGVTRADLAASRDRFGYLGGLVRFDIVRFRDPPRDAAPATNP